MGRLGNYYILEKIDETRSSIFFLGRKTDENSNVKIEILKVMHCTPTDKARFTHEYSKIKKMDISGIDKIIDIIEHDNTFVIVHEDFRGISLKTTINTTRFTTKAFLDIAMQLSDTLGQLHKNNIIHFEINPKNILINLETMEVKLTNFGISASITHKDEEIHNPEIVRGLLAYISPEQTQRMNRGIDHRSDLYSLGVTFYEMLCGKIPFESDDPMEIIHSHLAKKPIPLSNLEPSIPETISSIIMKLLSKNAEDRYQNSFGLLADLKKASIELKEKGVIPSFELGNNDFSLKFQIPQILVGRGEEISRIIQYFEEASKGERRIVLVHGEPGIGKSTLILELYKPITEMRGYFTTGKFEQFKKDVPYSSIIQAFQGIVKQILTESEGKIERWKNDFLDALGQNGKVITDIIPEIKLIIGEQPDIPILEPIETRNRFNQVFRKFISALSTEKHPLVIFIDDMQWADSASIDLISMLMTHPETKHLLLICSYRDNEVGPEHPLTVTWESIEKKSDIIRKIKLGPLTEENVNELILLALRKETDTHLLAKLVHKKTIGNPFFINQFLKNLFNDGLLVLNPSSGWSWDTEKIQEINFTDNVVEFMAGKIEKLPSETRNILKICSCIGNWFELPLVSTITGETIETVLHHIKDASDEGLVANKNDIFRFTHDRIQEAVYSLIPDEIKIATHRQIGNLIVTTTSKENLADKIFFIVNQLNYKFVSITGLNEKRKLMELNILAGEKAKASTAYSAAAKYLSVAYELLENDCWTNDYENTLNITLNLAQSEHLSQNFEKAEELFNKAIKMAKSGIDRASAYNLKSMMLISLAKFSDSMKVGIEGLKLLGINIPENPSQASILMNVMKIKLKIRKRKISSLKDLPSIENKKILMAMKIMMSISMSAYFTKQNILFFVTLKMVLLSIKYGNSPMGSFAYVWYGLLITSGLQDPKTGDEFGQLAVELNRKHGNIEFKPKIALPYGTLLSVWNSHVSRGIEILKDAVPTAYDNGDYNHVVWLTQSVLFCGMFANTPLEEMDSYRNKYHEFITRSGDGPALNYYISLHQFIKACRGETKNRLSFDDDSFTNSEHERKIETDNVCMIKMRHFQLKAIYLYIMGDFRNALTSIFIADNLLIYSYSQLLIPENYFFLALILSAICHTAQDKEKKSYLKQILEIRDKMKKWADSCPENFNDRLLLINAEIEYIKGNHDKAVVFFTEAIIVSKENKFILNTAIANELFASACKRKGYNKQAKSCIREAYIYYKSWGATIKAKELQENYPEIFFDTDPQEKIKYSDYIPNENISRNIDLNLDIEAVIKISQGLSMEVNLDKLIEKIMKMSIENAGAQRGVLILESKKNGKLYIEAEGKNDFEIKMTHSLPVAKSQEVPISLINYVFKTREEIVINDAENDNRFSNDLYIKNSGIRSILCSPITNQGKISGILYLENNLASNVFTKSKLKLMQIFYSLAAISIENSRLIAQREKMARLKTEMKIAAKIQSVLLPKKPFIEGYEITVYMNPAETVGGDYYDIINCENNDWVIIGDVAGHGVTAGMVMIMVQNSIHTYLLEHPDIMPTTLIRIANQAFQHYINNIDENMYVTITVFSFNKNGEVYFYGLHQIILIYRAKNKFVEKVESAGIWLSCWDRLHKFSEDNKELKMESGDVMLLYTDGITEAHDSNEIFFSLDNLIAIFQNCGHLSTEEIKNTILKGVEKYEIDDDVTLVVLKKR